MDRIAHRTDIKSAYWVYADFLKKYSDRNPVRYHLCRGVPMIKQFYDYKNKRAETFRRYANLYYKAGVMRNIE